METTRMRKVLIAAVCVLTWWANPASFSAAEAATIVWRKAPIPVNLVVGVEQMIILPSDAAIGLPPELANSNVFKTLVASGTAYWTALEPFGPTRVQVRLSSGEYLLFDVSARTEKAPPASMDTLQIVMAEPAADPGQVSAVGTSAPATATLFELIRYAAQDVYAPKRLVAPVHGIRSVPVGLSGNMNALYDQGSHRGLVVQPHKAWSAGGLYVTAFIVTNEHSHAITLDNRKVQHTAHARRSGVAPHFVASTFFETHLPPRGQPGNRTTLFVVTDQPINQVVAGL